MNEGAQGRIEKGLQIPKILWQQIGIYLGHLVGSTSRGRSSER